MSNDRILPIDRSKDVVSFEITVDGEIVDMSAAVSYLSVTRAVNRIPRARLVILDGRPAEETFEYSESDQFLPGAKIEIKAGYQMNNEYVFKGVITKHSIKVRQGQASKLIIECRDMAYRLTQGRKRKYYYESVDSDIMEEILDENELKHKVDATKNKHLNMVQASATDWDFILSRAEANGMIVNVTDGEVVISAPDISQDSSLNIIYGANILEFEGEIEMRNQTETVITKAWDVANQELLETEGKDLEYKHGNLKASDLAKRAKFSQDDFFHTGNLKQEELQGWADGRLMKRRLSKVRGRAKFQGLSKLYPNKTIELQGLGTRFNGNAFVSAVRHEISEGNWHTDVELGIDPELFTGQNTISEKAAAGILPAVCGLQVGIVTQLADDPDGEFRIRVTMPLVDPAGDGIWARVATLDAGEGRGSFFLPEIGDEVILGFLQDDPREGVVLGMLNSSAKPAPSEGTDDNHEKGFVTREGMKIWFHDEDKSITIHTPNGNELILSESEGSIVLNDENGNKLEMTSEGINLESPGDITIKATGDMKLEGNNVEITAAAELTAKGTASAEFSSSGITDLKGAMVNIN